MNSRIRSVKIFCAFVLLSSLILSSCGRNPSTMAKKDRAVAYVNKEPISVSELQRQLDIRARLDPSFKITAQTERAQLDMLIAQKLIIQEAIKQGLATKENFVNTIKTFWEQTLVREFMDYKKQEYEKLLKATEGEIKEFYKLLGQKVTFQALRSNDQSYIQGVYDQIRANTLKEQLTWETVGPLSYDAVVLGPLKKAFSLPVGEIALIEQAPVYYLIKVENREAVNLPPLEQIRGEVEKRVLALKEQQLFNEWLQKEKNKAAIKIPKQ